MSTWKQRAIEGMNNFSDKVGKAQNNDEEIKEPHAKIWQLEVENNFCHKNSGDEPVRPQLYDPRREPKFKFYALV